MNQIKSSCLILDAKVEQVNPVQVPWSKSLANKLKSPPNMNKNLLEISHKQRNKNGERKIKKKVIYSKN